MQISTIYNSIETAREIKKKIYSTDLGGEGRLEGFETEVVNRFGKKVPLACLPR